MNTKFTEEDVQTIRDMCASRKATPKEMAQRFGVTVLTIYNIIHRSSYREVLATSVELAARRKDLSRKRAVLEQDRELFEARERALDSEANNIKNLEAALNHDQAVSASILDPHAGIPVIDTD